MAQFINARFEMFKSQDLDNGHFDLKFEIEGKTIYAHKFMLATVSEVLKVMISDTWNTGEFIKVETYSYKDFYELLTFIYSGECKINDENIFTLVDLSEFYQIKSLQQKCDEYLSQKEYTSENVIIFIETYLNYSLPLFEKSLSKCFKRNHLVESKDFFELSKEMIKKIVSFEERFVSEEKLFEKVYEWAENRALKKQEESKNENFILNDAIKTKITEFLPYIRFKKMNYKFLHTFVVERRFLFTNDEWNEILENAKSGKKVRVTNANGKSIYCMLPFNSDVIEHVKALKDCSSAINTHQYVYWETIFKRPSRPSSIWERYCVDWYLVYLDNGQICVMHYAFLRYTSVYLIAEMTAETGGFRCTRNCKIEIE